MCSAQYDIIKHLVEVVKVNINKQDFSGRTPFMYAASTGSLWIIKYLKEIGAD